MVGEAVALHEQLLSEGSLAMKRLSRIELARDFKSAGLMDRAIAHLAVVVRDDPGNRTALEELEEIHLRMRNWGQAIRTRQSMSRTPACARVLAHEWAASGRSSLEAGKGDYAAFAFEISIRTAPFVADGYVGLGDVFESRGRRGVAARLWLRALRLRCDLGSALYPRLSRVLEPARLGALLGEQASRGDRLAALWLARGYFAETTLRARGDSMAISARLERTPVWSRWPWRSRAARRARTSVCSPLSSGLECKRRSKVCSSSAPLVECGGRSRAGSVRSVSPGRRAT